MKQLGTVIDLQKGSRYLRALDRSLSLTEGNTGILIVKIQDVCKNDFFFLILIFSPDAVLLGGGKTFIFIKRHRTLSSLSV